MPRDSAGDPGYGGCPAAPACPPAVAGAASDAAGPTPARMAGLAGRPWPSLIRRLFPLLAMAGLIVAGMAATTWGARLIAGGSSGRPVGADNPVMATDLVSCEGRGLVRLGIWLREASLSVHVSLNPRAHHQPRRPA